MISVTRFFRLKTVYIMNHFIAIWIRQACSYVLYWNHLESIIIYRESIMLWCRLSWESCVMINNVCNISSGLIGCIYCSSKLIKNIGIARSWILCFGTMFITIWFTSCMEVVQHQATWFIMDHKLHNMTVSLKYYILWIGLSWKPE